MTFLPPFAAKEVPAGKLFRRKHGFSSSEISAGQTGTIILSVPYNTVKVNEFEFINCSEGDTVNFKVLDTPTGTLSTTPNYLLNQFGFSCQMPTGFYKDFSQYDADLIKDMQIQIEYTNNSGSAKTIKGNIVYHEVKP